MLAREQVDEDEGLAGLLMTWRLARPIWARAAFGNHQGGRDADVVTPTAGRTPALALVILVAVAQQMTVRMS